MGSGSHHTLGGSDLLAGENPMARHDGRSQGVRSSPRACRLGRMVVGAFHKVFFGTPAHKAVWSRRVLRQMAGLGRLPHDPDESPELGQATPVHVAPSVGRPEVNDVQWFALVLAPVTPNYDRPTFDPYDLNAPS